MFLFGNGCSFELLDPLYLESMSVFTTVQYLYMAHWAVYRGWLGSTALFEEEVRTSVVSALSNQLWGQMLSYKQLGWKRGNMGAIYLLAEDIWYLFYIFIYSINTNFSIIIEFACFDLWLTLEYLKIFWCWRFVFAMFRWLGNNGAMAPWPHGTCAVNFEIWPNDLGEIAAIHRHPEEEYRIHMWKHENMSLEIDICFLKSFCCLRHVNLSLCLVLMLVAAFYFHSDGHMFLTVRVAKVDCCNISRG